MFKKLKNCHNSKDFRTLAKQRIPSPIFNYIDGAADDEITLLQNTKSFEKCDLVPNILRGVEEVDLSVTLMGKKINLPLFFSPTALQRLFHHQGELAVGKVAEKFGTFFGISSLATVSIEEIAKNYSSTKMFQLYVHKDQGLNNNMIEKCIENNFDAIAGTVDTIVAGNRERDFYTGFTSPPKLTLSSLISFATHPNWTLNYLLRKKIASIYFKYLKHPFILLPTKDTKIKKNSWHLFVIRIKKSKKISRDNLNIFLAKNNIGSSVHYVPIHKHTFWKKKLKFNKINFPNTEKAYSEILSLPIYPNLKEIDVRRVIKKILFFLKAN